nr:hypothetical protein L204_02901 [Cryptococcus depauperatus CBS 7855]
MFALFSVLALLASALAQTTPNGSASAVDIEEAQLTPGLLASFDPSALLSVSFGGQAISIGQNLAQNAVSSSPDLSVSPSSNATIASSTLYTVIMVDADIVGTDESKTPQTRHWLVNSATFSAGSTAPYAVNWTGSTSITNYAGPGPESGSGPHRYVVIVYEQPSDFSPPSDLSTAGTALGKMSLSDYVTQSKLGKLLTANYFQVENGQATVTPSPTSAVNSSTLPGYHSTTVSSPSSGTFANSASGSKAATTSASTEKKPGAASKTSPGWGIVLGSIGMVGAIVGAGLYDLWTILTCAAKVFENVVVPLPVERSQGSVSALVARFQTAADRDRDCKEKEGKRVSLGLGGGPGTTGRKASDFDSHTRDKEKDEGLSEKETRKLLTEYAPKESPLSISTCQPTPAKDAASFASAALTTAALPLEGKDQKLPPVNGHISPSPQTRPQSQTPEPLCSNQVPNSRQTTSVVKAKSPSRSKTSTPPSTNSVGKLFAPSLTDRPHLLAASKAKPSQTGDHDTTQERTLTQQSHPAIPAPLKLHLTGPLSKPTASFLAKTKTPPSSNGIKSLPNTEGAKSSLRRKESVKSPSTSSEKGSLGRTSGRTSLTKADTRNGLKTPEKGNQVKNEKIAHADKKTNGPTSMVSGSRLMQGTAASRARAAANTQSNPPSHTRSQSYTSAASKTGAKTVRPRASNPSSSPIQSKSATKRVQPKSSITREAGDKDDYGKPTIPIGRIGLAAAREKPTMEELDPQVNSEKSVSEREDETKQSLTCEEEEAGSLKHSNQATQSTEQSKEKLEEDGEIGKAMELPPKVDQSPSILFTPTLEEHRDLSALDASEGEENEKIAGEPEISSKETEAG